MKQSKFDFLILGAGIVGLSVAKLLTEKYPEAKICVIEKEAALGKHASGRNSGVLHSGIYYSSETLKAKLCAHGARLMQNFAYSESISFKRTGKVIVATNEMQSNSLRDLMINAKCNNIPAEIINETELSKLEPFASSEFGAIYCPSTAVIDGRAVLTRLYEILATRGVCFKFREKFLDRIGQGMIRTNNNTYNYGFLFNCAGSYADKIAKKFGLAEDYVLVPFKGIYWKLTADASRMVNSNIYPVPDPAIPFLGVHLTRTIFGDVYAGPTAIPAFGRENYGVVSGINLHEALEVGTEVISMYLRNQNNFRRIARSEILKYFKANFLASVKKLVPTLTSHDLQPTTKVGIRPQLVNKSTKKLEMDYILQTTDDSIHVLNAISPAFTSSFAFSEMIVDAAGLGPH